MKKICFTLAVVFTQIAFAQTSSLSLIMEGSFKKVDSKYATGYHNRKACRAMNGKYVGRGVCRLDETQAQMAVEKSPYSDTYKIRIENKTASGDICSFEALGAQKNRVQAVAVVDECELTLGYTSPTTVSTWTTGNCPCDIKVDGFSK